MALSAFDDKTKLPKTSQLYRELGRSATVWRALTEWLAENYDPLDQQWVFYAQNWGWTLKLVHKKRTVLYMTPCRRYFLVGFMLGEKAASCALEMDLPKGVAETIKTAKKYVEGRAVRLEVRYKKDLPIVQRVAEAKMSN
ncbi:MAG: DUF3788 family protein [Candidatus Latescibacterota bacterium]|nr:MAG: DUF3788 family protein [Candidatus Latescibacterota bacterium]